jgi:hypothetical protein
MTSTEARDRIVFEAKRWHAAHFEITRLPCPQCGIAGNLSVSSTEASTEIECNTPLERRDSEDPSVCGWATVVHCVSALELPEPIFRRLVTHDSDPGLPPAKRPAAKRAPARRRR